MSNDIRRETLYENYYFGIKLTRIDRHPTTLVFYVINERLDGGFNLYYSKEIESSFQIDEIINALNKAKKELA